MASADSTLFSHEEISPKFDKSPNALRTISEASEQLDVPQHVLRFWETKFPQIKPLKRNGGRRFYRPQDLDVLQQIKHLLYSQGYTIKGAKKAVDEFIHARAERGVSHSEWMEQVPPANTNDNVDYSTPQETGDLLAELAEALRETEEVAVQVAAVVETPVAAPAMPTDELKALRDDIARARDILKLRLMAAAA